MSDVSGNIPFELCFFEGQRKCLEEDPKLRCSVSYLLNQLETNASLCNKWMRFPYNTNQYCTASISSIVYLPISLCHLVHTLYIRPLSLVGTQFKCGKVTGSFSLSLNSLLGFQNALIFRKLTAKMKSSFGSQWKQ